ncbi:MAG: anhydro-N-acetylmuramic acid kinase [Gammaproteobacteria bacterium]|nr:anhydro-N-acetylmuramic acid kinase [Gammaproteobacteria bacterium]MCW8986992.1 anhydro-N-acetylmuramic acid kinase [Gammaproteobacteria bacterium]MCW9032015.1 anhydro-N-acetylmuramic acid kinase [Gammaproteobacteria bacterium]
MADDLYIGLMSGTSLDGIDAVLVEFKNDQVTVVDSTYLPLPSSLKNEIKSLINPGENEINRLTALDVKLGKLFAEAVKQLITKENINKEDIIAIGSHGQTIRHLPGAEFPSTLQISDPNIIAEETGITTVADFRRRDMAAGGQGAPLVPAFHEKIFRDTKKNRVILNLGGIANITLLPADHMMPVTGFDTGPANTLINHWIQQQQNKNYDESGRWASSGEIDESFLEHLLNDDYFNLAPPKSTGTEYFNAAWLTKKLSKFPFLAAKDVQASLTTFTAKTITDAIKAYSNNLDEIIICGGGVHNDFLLQQLTLGLSHIEINSSAKYGLDPDFIEATAFAWLARQTLEHKPGNLPEVTGAKRAVILGGIYY